MAQQTAVEWFLKEIIKNARRDWKDTNVYELAEQAKQMEKERHDKWNEFLNAEKTLGVSDVKTIERVQWYYNQYFKETYEK